MRKQKAAIAALIVVLVAGLWAVPPRDSGDWAAWVQAAGVIAAVLWSLRLQSLHAGEGARHATRVATMFASNMYWVFRELNDACIKRSWPDYVVNRRILEEILAQGREVPLQLLEGRALAMVTSLRAIGVEALEFSQPHTANSDWRALQAYFDKRLPSIAAWLTATGTPPDQNGPTDYAGLRTSFSQLGGL